MRKEVVEKFAALITAAFGLIAALAWNDAIKSIFSKFYTAGEGILAMLVYAIVVTLIAIVMTLWIGRIAEKTKK